MITGTASFRVLVAAVAVVRTGRVVRRRLGAVAGLGPRVAAGADVGVGEVAEQRRPSGDKKDLRISLRNVGSRGKAPGLGGKRDYPRASSGTCHACDLRAHATQ
jgi:hypothetical protein